jgi:hypothetical protein
MQRLWGLVSFISLIYATGCSESTSSLRAALYREKDGAGHDPLRAAAEAAFGIPFLSSKVEPVRLNSGAAGADLDALEQQYQKYLRARAQ